MCSDKKVPDKPGHYLCAFPGDSETEGPHVYYEYPDYTEWGYWTTPPDDPEVEPDDYSEGGYWTFPLSEPDGMIAWFGPVEVPKLP